MLLLSAISERYGMQKCTSKAAEPTATDPAHQLAKPKVTLRELVAYFNLHIFKDYKQTRQFRLGHRTYSAKQYPGFNSHQESFVKNNPPVRTDLAGYLE